jgi:hypothetical protein
MFPLSGQARRYGIATDSYWGYPASFIIGALFAAQQ